MITVEGNISIGFETEDDEEALETLKRLGFRWMFSDSIKKGLESKFGELKKFEFDLLPEYRDK
mgnify:CR=1 FL=1